MREELSLDSVVVRSSGLIASEIDNEVVALNIESGTCYGLDAIGSRIWALVAQPLRVREICSKLVAEYQVEPEVCARDVIALIDELRAEKLVVVTNEA